MVVLITGASGGFGHVLGKRLSKAGMTVYGTSRDATGKEEQYGFPFVSLDATDDESTEACVNMIVEREGRIDVLVNCINELFIGKLEEATVEETRALYDTNVFGMMRVCQKVIPVMRKQGGGTIINMSSAGGIVAVPYMSAYTSSKFALEAMSEAMRFELKEDNIDVVIMQPVAMHMDRPASGAHMYVVEGAAPSSPSHGLLVRMDKDTKASKLTPEIVAKRVHEVILSNKKPLRVPMDRAKQLTLIKRLAPRGVIDKLLTDVMTDAQKNAAKA